MPANLNQIKGKALAALLTAAEEEKKDFCETGKKVAAFGHKAKQEDIFAGMDLQARLWYRTTVSLTAQSIDLMGPYLYPSNPYRCGTVRKHQYALPEMAELTKARNGLMVEYLNYTPEECDLYGESIRSINQSMVHGAGLIWTGFDQRKGLVHSVYGNVNELLIDPDVISMDRAQWIARKREKKRWELIDEMPEARNLIASLQPSKTSKANTGKVNDLIEYYEVWMRVGLHRFIDGGLPPVDEKGNIVQMSDQPRKYLVTKEGKLLKETTWEAPLFTDNLWPVEMVSYVEDEDSVWPISPLASSLPFQEALNWLFIFYMTKMRFCSRSLFALMDYGQDGVGADNLDKLQMMDDMPFLKIRVDNDQLKIGDLFQQLDLNPGLENFEKAHAIIKREHQEHSGLYDILHYGEGETQDRSATATEFKEKTAKTRINYRLDRVKKWQGKIARKEAMIARFIHTPEQIDVILGQGAGQIWGQIMPPAEAAQNPAAVNFQQWFLETDYSIEADSMRRNDHQTKVDALKEAMNTVVPVQIQSVDLSEKAAAYDTIAEYYEAIGVTDEIVQKQTDLANYFRMQAQMQAQMAQQMQTQGAQMQQEQQMAQQQQQEQMQQVSDQAAEAQKTADQATKEALTAREAALQAIEQAHQAQLAAKEAEKMAVASAKDEQAARMQASSQPPLVINMPSPVNKRSFKLARGPDGLISGIDSEDAE